MVLLLYQLILLPPKQIKVSVFLLEKNATAAAALVNSVWFDDSLTLEEKGLKLAGKFTGMWKGVVDLSSKPSEYSDGKMVGLNKVVLNGSFTRDDGYVDLDHSIIATGNIFYKKD